MEPDWWIRVNIQRTGQGTMSDALNRAQRYRDRTAENLGLADRAANEDWRNFYAVVAEFYATLAQGEEQFAARVEALRQQPAG